MYLVQLQHAVPQFVELEVHAHHACHRQLLHLCKRGKLFWYSSSEWGISLGVSVQHVYTSGPRVSPMQPLLVGAKLWDQVGNGEVAHHHCLGGTCSDCNLGHMGGPDRACS